MAMHVTLDGRLILSEDSFHKALGNASGCTWYGANLDALWDLLTGIVEPPIRLSWNHAATSQAAMGPRFAKVINVLREAQIELGAENFTLEITE